MNAFEPNSLFLSECLNKGYLDEVNFSLVDVGCSGGIDSFWNQFGSHLKAVGFDPLLAEIDRLRANAPSNIEYFAAWIDQGSRHYPAGVTTLADPIHFQKSVTPQRELTSTWAASRRMNFFHEKEVFNQGSEVEYTDKRFSIDQWLAENAFPKVDILKSDVDGFDYEVLLGASDLLSGKGKPLAVITEAQLQEPKDKRGTAFGDIDRMLRDHGYRLFDIDVVFRYTRSALPGKFVYDMFAQTKEGAPSYCDALYMLDPVLDTSILDELLEKDDQPTLLKLVVLYECFGLEDCAAALLVELRKTMTHLGKLDISWALNSLVPANNPYDAESYDKFLSAFDSEPKKMFPLPSRSKTYEALYQRAWIRAISNSPFGKRVRRSTFGRWLLNQARAR